MQSSADLRNPSRRDFGRVLASYLLGLCGVLGVAGITRFLSFEVEPARRTEFDLGPAAGYEPGTRRLVDQIPALVIRDDAGFTALSLVCTHLGCTVEEAVDGFECPCHGSRYDAGGQVLRGPAREPLRTLRTEITAEGNVIVHFD